MAGSSRSAPPGEAHEGDAGDGVHRLDPRPARLAADLRGLVDPSEPIPPELAALGRDLADALDPAMAETAQSEAAPRAETETSRKTG